MIRFACAAAIAFAASAGPALAACPQSVAKFQKLIDTDLKTGFIAKDVYAKANSDLTGAGKLCKEGQDAAASAAVSATRSRYGYPPER
jgi:hypothetical protein